MIPHYTRISLASMGRLILAGAVTLAQTGIGYSHDRDVHDKMTDVAYEIMLAVTTNHPTASSLPVIFQHLTNLEAVPGMTQFYSDMTKAVQKLRVLPSALPAPQNTACLNENTINAVGLSPDWKIPANSTLANMPMSQVAFAVTSDFMQVNGDCNIDGTWQPGGGGIYLASNPSGPMQDRTGNVLGFWAQHPDEKIDDWHLYSPAGGTLNAVKTMTEAGLAAGATALVSLGCSVACMIPFACLFCITKTSEAADSVVTAVDHLPDFTDWADLQFTGMGHHVDMKPFLPGIPKFDDNHGFYTDDPGPFHTRDSMEALLTASSDLLGLRVKFDPSLGPKNYQTELAAPGDFDPNSVLRSLNDWEAQTWPHTQFTPVDNLALFGWQQFEAMAGAGSFAAPGVSMMRSVATQHLGWPLHAIGDATVPMHVTNTAGWGHRPYEDAVAHMLLPQANGDTPLLSENDPNMQAANVDVILKRALVFRKMISDWRAAHPAMVHEVPVRDLVTAVGSSTFQKSIAQANSIFDSGVSLLYMVDSNAATSAYDNPNNPAIRNISLDLMLDGIAAEIAFLTSAMEVLP